MTQAAPQKTLPAPAVIATLWATRKQPESGLMLKAVRESKGWTQRKLADLLAVDRVTVLQWEGGHNWPIGDNLHRLQAALLGNQLLTDSQVSAVEIDQLLKNLAAAGQDSLQIAHSLVTYAYPKILASLILKAQGVGADSRCIGLFFDHRKEVLRDFQLSTQVNVSPLSPSQPAWASGDVYATPTSSVSTPAPVEQPSEPVRNQQDSE